jgi:hypothetical protein
MLKRTGVKGVTEFRHCLAPGLASADNIALRVKDGDGEMEP